MLVFTGCQHAREHASPDPITVIDPEHIVEVDVTNALLYSRRFNCQLSAPGGGWMVEPGFGTTDPKREDSLDRRYFLLEKNLEAAFQAYPVEDIEAWNEEGRAVADAHSSLHGAQSVRIWTERGQGGLTWELTQLRAGEQATRQNYRLFHRGIAYQFDVWETDPSGDDRTLEEAGIWLLRSFELINPRRFVYDSSFGDGLLTDSPFFGYRIRGEREAGQPIETPEADRLRRLPLVDFTFDHPGGYTLAVLPIYFGEPDIHLDALTHAYVTVLGMDPDMRLVERFRAINYDGVRGREFAQPALTKDGKVFWRALRVLVSPPNAFAIVVMVPPEYPGETLDEVFQLFDAFELRPVHDDFREGPPLNTSEMQAHAQFLNAVGMYHLIAADARRALPFIRRAAVLAPDGIRFTINLVDNLVSLSRHDEALALLAAALTRWPAQPLLLARRAFVHGRIGNVDAALKDYEDAVSGGVKDEAFLSDYIWRLVDKDPEASLPIIRNLARSIDNDIILRGEAHALEQLGRLEEAETVLLSMQERFDIRPEAAHQLIDLYLSDSRFEDAYKLARAFADTSDRADAYYYMGVARFAMEDFRDARRYFEAALEREPAFAEARDFLDFTHAALGRGDAGIFGEEVPAVELPRELRRRMERTRPPASAEEHGAWSEWIGRAIYSRKGEPHRQTWYIRSEVQSLGALAELNEVSIPFHPLFDAVWVNRLIVFDEEGTIVSEGDLEGCYVSDDFRDGIFTGRKLLNIPVPGLQTGGSYELVVSRQSQQRSQRFEFTDIDLFGWFPRALSFVWLESEEPFIGSATNFEEAATKLPGGTLWIVENPPVYRPEPYMPPAADVFPKIWIGPNNQTWEEISSEYAERIADFLAPEPGIADLAAEIVGDATETYERISRIHEYLQDRFTYRGVLFGVRAQIPNKTGQIRVNRYGDCKDHTILMLQLLRALKIDAYPALVNTRGEFVTSLPSLGQFDHMILYIPELMPQPFLDPADKDLPAGFVPRGLAGAETLLVGYEGPVVAQVPEYDPSLSRVAVERDMKFGSESNLIVSEKLVAEGYYAAFLRGALRARGSHEWDGVIREFLNDRGTYLSPRELVVRNLQDRAKPLEIAYTYYMTRRPLFENESWVAGRLPATWDAHVFEVEPRSLGADLPFRIHYPVTVSTLNRLRIPDGYTVHAPKERSDVLSAFDYQSSVANGDGMLTHQFELTLRSGDFPAAEWQDFLAAADSIVDILELPIVLQVTD